MSEYDKGFRDGYTESTKNILFGLRQNPTITGAELEVLMLGIFDGDNINDDFFADLERVKKEKLES